MPSILFEDEQINQHYQVSLSYRWTPWYQSAFEGVVKKRENLFPLRLPAAPHNLMGQPAGPHLLWRLIWILSKLYAFFLYDLVRLYWFFRRLRPDILHLNNGGYPAAESIRPAAIAARLAGVRRIILHVNSKAQDLPQDPRYVVERLLDRLTAKVINRYVCGSEENVCRMAQVRGFPPEKGMVLFNTPHPSKAILKTHPAEVRARLLGSPRRELCVFLAVGHLQRHKGHGVLIEATQLLKNMTDHPFEAWIEGFGECELEYRATIERHNLLRHVRMLGRVSSVQDYINACDVFVHPSYGFDDLPNVVSEALQFGKPCIGTRHVGIPSQVTEKTGILVEPNDPAGLAHAMLKLLGDPALRAALGNGARRHFTNTFAYETVIPQYLRFYDRCLANNAPNQLGVGGQAIKGARGKR